MLVALVALVLSVSGNAAAAVIITSNGQVARGTIAGHHPAAGSHPNIETGSINATDLANGLKASLHERCPSGLQKAGSLCFDPAPQAHAVWLVAVKTCADRFLRLPSVGELARVFESTEAQQSRQWTDDMYFDETNNGFYAVGLTQDDVRDLSYGTSIVSNSSLGYRCVTTAGQ
jgi:hypothetical protein